MQRKFKNILMIVLIVLLGTSMYFTIDSAKDSLSSQSSTQDNNGMNGSGGTPPDINSALPEKPSEDNNSSSSDNNMGKPPEKPDNDITSSDNPSSENQNSSDNNQMGPGNNNSSMTPSNMNENQENSDSNLSVLYYVVFGVERLALSLFIIYLLMSGFNKKTLKETMTSSDKKIIYILSVIILTGCLTAGESLLANNTKTNTNNIQKQTISTETITEASGATVVDGTEETLNDTYESETADESPILVKNGGTANIKNATINKKNQVIAQIQETQNLKVLIQVY